MYRRRLEEYPDRRASLFRPSSRKMLSDSRAEIVDEPEGGGGQPRGFRRRRIAAATILIEGQERAVFGQAGPPPLRTPNRSRAAAFELAKSREIGGSRRVKVKALWPNNWKQPTRHLPLDLRRSVSDELFSGLRR